MSEDPVSSYIQSFTPRVDRRAMEPTASMAAGYPPQQPVNNRRHWCQMRWPRLIAFLYWRYRRLQWLRSARYAWYFRVIGSDDHGWQIFEPKNQETLWQAYFYQPHVECQLYDRAVGDQQLIRVVLIESLGFSVDPDWLRPVEYEVKLREVTRTKKRWCPLRRFSGHREREWPGSVLTTTHDSLGVLRKTIMYHHYSKYNFLMCIHVNQLAYQMRGVDNVACLNCVSHHSLRNRRTLAPSILVTVIAIRKNWSACAVVILQQNPKTKPQLLQTG